eukprot:11999657-Alexandrium_andersonii.AAC.1
MELERIADSRLGRCTTVSSMATGPPRSPSTTRGQLRTPRPADRRLRRSRAPRPSTGGGRRGSS